MRPLGQLSQLPHIQVVNLGKRLVKDVGHQRPGVA